MKRVLINGSEKILIAIILLYSIFVTIVNPSFLSLMTLFDIIRSASCTMVVAMERPAARARAGNVSSQTVKQNSDSLGTFER